MSMNNGPQDDLRREPARKPPGAPICLLNNNALLAEDTAAQLRYFGHQVEVIHGIDQLFEQVSQSPPAAVVIDFEYRPDWLSKIAHLVQHKQAANRHFPVMLISTRGSFDARLAAARVGADCYFTRPLDMMALMDRLDALTLSREARPYRILIIGDNAAAAEYHGTVLSGAGMEVRLLDKLTDMFRILDEYRPELVLVDVAIVGCSGADLAKLIRQNSAYLDVPIAFLSDDADFSKQLDAIRSGADDFLVKPIEPAQLVASLSSRAERYRALRRLIMRDSLTGLYNHSAIKEFLAREVSSSSRTGQPVALAMVDLDFFKRINDSHGHPVGDQVIRALSRLLQQRLRRGDVIGRYGGEEFAVVLPNTRASAALGVLDQIREAFANIRHHADQCEFGASFSAGVADVAAHRDADTLFRAADAALYQAKRMGRNRIEIG
jgi:diguanylate cyclase (GGDEF)-like protein